MSRILTIAALLAAALAFDQTLLSQATNGAIQGQ